MRTSRIELFSTLLTYSQAQLTSKIIGLMQADDRVIWEWAKQNEFTLVSKDTDFYQKAIVLGHPPKFIWLRVGNCSTSLITTLLRSRHEIIRQFIDEATESLLVMER
ncbi:MAG: DUF5615 family PIN-like protein [Pyrinomonadaceae bacterium]